ncbi:MAG: hypothetical protein AMXMBFR23_13880 [Chloroflexota bacterium]
MRTETERPRAFRMRPSEAATMPFPTEETTPPVTKTYLAMVGSTLAAGRAGFPPSYGRTGRGVELRCLSTPAQAPHSPGSSRIPLQGDAIEACRGDGTGIRRGLP